MKNKKNIFIFLIIFSVLCYRFYDCYFNNFCGLTKTTKAVERYGAEFNLTISFLIIGLIISVIFMVFFLKKKD